MRPYYRFAHNLRRDTSDETYCAALKPWGYLVAPANATRVLRERAHQLCGEGYHLIADNGNFEIISDLREQYVLRANALLAEVQRLEGTLKRCVQVRDLPTDLRRRFDALAREVRQEVGRVLAARGHPLPQQLSLRPTSLIGAEDISVAVWLALNLEQTYTGYARTTFRQLNNVVARRAVSDCATLSPALSRKYFPVASALSYNTAFDAGQVFARRGHRRVAMGFGAYMADDNYIDTVEIGRRKIALPVLMPNRYLRTVAVARGFWDGYRAEMGKPPEAFHFLGLGAPIMLALVAVCAWGTTELSFDAMSPIKDAVEGTLYTSQPAYMKLRCRGIAYRLATEAGGQWECPCPVCKAFVMQHPFRYDVGRQWHTRTRAKSVEAVDLKPGGALYDVYPLLSEPDIGPLRQAVSKARMGHNHWVLSEIVKALRRHAGSAQQLRTFVRGITVAYGKTTSSARFAASIDFAYRLAVNDA